MDVEVWDIFATIGTLSFSIQGALIAIEKEYDLFAVYLFGILTAFGGGVIRNVVIGGSDYDLWNQEALFLIAVTAITIILVFPQPFRKSEIVWTNYLDAIGLIAFAVQGSIDAVQLNLPASAAVVSAMITATGGGLIRDLLSQRQPILLGEVVYGLWVFLVGLIIGMRWVTTQPEFLVVFLLFTTLRILSFLFNWKVPYRKYQKN